MIVFISKKKEKITLLMIHAEQSFSFPLVSVPCYFHLISYNNYFLSFSACVPLNFLLICTKQGIKLNHRFDL